MTAWDSVSGPSYELLLGFPDETRFATTVARLVADDVASGIAAQDATLWGPEAEEEAAQRLSWVDLPEASRPLVAEVETLRDELRAQGLDRVVLCGMGGSSLAPEVICGAAGVPLVVLDASDPDSVRRATGTDLDRTVAVVSSKSGGTVETDSQRRAFTQAFLDAGLDPADRIVVVTDPGSPLAEQATAAGHRTFLADPDVGGRYSALTAFGLVPSGLAGADVGTLLDEAAALRPVLAQDSPDNPALRLGALLGTAHADGVDKLVLADDGSTHPGLGDWVEQLVAESTGKHGKGVLPVVVDGVEAPEVLASTPDSVLVTYGPDPALDSLHPASGYAVALDAPLGGQVLLWEHATAVVGRLLGINPFDQPDVESAKTAARGMLDAPPTGSAPDLVADGIEVRGLGALAVPGDATLDQALSGLLDALAAEGDRGYLAVMAYADRDAFGTLADVRPGLARRTRRPVTFGWGPRFLHSTGQLHKGGPPVGAFLQVTVAARDDLPVPGREFTFGRLVAAQAAGDAQVLADHGRPVLRLHVTEPEPEGRAFGRLRSLLGADLPGR
ncbi:MAG: glucose-6-phosphate isomerase [Nocardioides sp.]|nr:glucose-6-phosphate isomerase [Nocardioides sp.]